MREHCLRTQPQPPDRSVSPDTPGVAARRRENINLLQWLLGPLLDQLNRIEQTLITLQKGQQTIMGLVQVAQEDLDQLDTDIDAATQALSDKLDALAAAHPELPAADLSALKADVDTLRGLGAPAAVEEPPAE